MFKALLLSLALSNAADTTSSLVAFRGGAHEINPFIISERPALFIAQVSAATAAEIWLATRMNKNHPKLTRGLLLVGIGAGAWATSHNIGVIREQRR